MTANENCSHGIRLFGKDPPPCDQCELEWCEMMVRVKTEGLEKAQRELEAIRQKITSATSQIR